MATSMTTKRLLEEQQTRENILKCMQNPRSAKAFIPPHSLQDVWKADLLSRFLDTLKPEDTSDSSVQAAFKLLNTRMLAIISILVYIGWDHWTKFWETFILFDPFKTPSSTEHRSEVCDRHGSKYFDRLDDYLPFDANELDFLEDQAQQFLDAQYIFQPIIIMESVDSKIHTYSSLARLPFIEKKSSELGEGGYGRVTKEVVAIRCLDHRTSTSENPNPNLKETPLAVKQFASTFDFDEEWDNLRRLASSLTKHEHVLSFTSIIVIEQEGVLALEGQKKCHILMPLADRDLWGLLSDVEIQLDLFEVLRQSCFLLGGLKFLHENLAIDGNVRTACSHGDLKPNNILVYKLGTARCPVGHWKIADFGLSTIRSGKKISGGAPLAKATGYHAPENMVSPCSDIWSMGCINFWTLFRVQESASRLEEMNRKRGLAADGKLKFGHDYFHRQGPMDELIANPHVMEWLTQPTIKASPNSIVSEWSEVITKMLMVEPTERIGISEAYERLAALLSGNPIEHRDFQQLPPNTIAHQSPSHPYEPLRESISDISAPTSSVPEANKVGPCYISPNESDLIRVRRWKETVRDHNAIQDDALADKVLSWLSNFDYRERWKVLQAKWHQGTLRRIFEEEQFLKWSDFTQNSNDINGDSMNCPPVLWYYGAPGVGKSVMVSEVVKYLMGANVSSVAVLYLFCDYKDRAKQSLLELMSSLVRQAAEQALKLGPLPTNIIRAYKRDPNGTSKLDLGECRSTLVALLRGFKGSFILLDGLDEYVHSDGETKATKPVELLEKVHEIMLDCGDSCRMLLTSREPTLAFHEDINASRIPIRADDNDIRSFVSSYIISPRFNLHQKVKENENLRLSVTDSLTQRADGQFLLPLYHLLELEEFRSPRALKEHLESLPLDLCAYYQIALDRIAHTNGSRQSERLGFKILGFLLQARYNLTLEAFQHALAVRPLEDTKFCEDGLIQQKFILSDTFGLVTVQENKVQFAHHTVLEFLKDPAIYKKHFASSPAIFALTCMTYITFQDFAVPCQDPEDLPKLYNTFPFLPYAVGQLGYHASMAVSHSTETEQDFKLKSRFESFLAGDIPLGALQVFASKILQRPFGTRIKNWRKDSPLLHLAILMRLDDILRDMLDKGVDIEERGDKNETPLHMAARCGNKIATELLLKRNADVNKTNYSGKNALEMIMQRPFLGVSVRLHEAEFVKNLIASLLFRFVEDSLTPRTKLEQKIFTSVMSEDEKSAFIQRLASAGQDQERLQARTDLILGANVRMDITDEEEELVHIFIDAGIDLNCKVSVIQTPLQCAIIYGRKKVVEHLLEKKANIWLDYTLGRNALELAQNHPRTEVSDEIMKLIRDRAEKIVKEEELEPDEKKKELIPGPYQAKKLLQLGRERERGRLNEIGLPLLLLMERLSFNNKGTPQTEVKFSSFFVPIVEQVTNKDQASDVEPQEQTQKETRMDEGGAPIERGQETLNLDRLEPLSNPATPFKLLMSTQQENIPPPDTPPTSLLLQSPLEALAMEWSTDLPQPQISKRRRTPGLDEVTPPESSMSASQAERVTQDTPLRPVPPLWQELSDMDNPSELEVSETPRKRPRISGPDEPAET